jgi:predicted aldo/keto reductase-like oxidoreductase
MYAMIAYAKKHDVGVICKKVLAGGERLWQRRPDRKRDVEFQIDKSNTTLGQAMLKWALDVPGVTAVVPLITNFEHLEEDIAAGFAENTLPSAASRANRRALEDLAGELSAEYCRSCSRCVSTCPKQIPVADIFRYELYYSAYNRPEHAKQLYNELPSGKAANQCNECGACEESCPHSLPIMAKLRLAHSLLA